MSEVNELFYPYDRRELVHSDCPNFFMYEVFKSGTALRNNIDNTQGFTDDLRKNAAGLVSLVLQPLRYKYGPIRLSSWYRCEELEKTITWLSFLKWKTKQGLEIEGDEKFMWQQYFQRKSHPKGNCGDFEIPGTANDYLFQDILDQELPFDQLIREFAVKDDPMSGWIHVSVWEDHQLNRHQSFDIK